MTITPEELDQLLDGAEDTQSLARAINDHLSSNAHQFTLDEVREMRPAEIERAREAGQLDQLLGRGGRR